MTEILQNLYLFLSKTDYYKGTGNCSYQIVRQNVCL